MKNLFFSVVRNRIFSFFGNLSVCLFNTQISSSSIANSLIQSDSLLFCPPHFQPLVFKHLTWAFSHKLTARCHTLQIISNCFQVGAGDVNRFHNLPCVQPCISFIKLHNRKFAIKHVRKCITSPCIIRPTGQYTLWLHDDQSDHDTLLLYKTASLQFTLRRCFICTMSFKFRRAPVKAMEKIGRWATRQRAM